MSLPWYYLYGWFVAIASIIILLTAIWAAWAFRNRMRELGEILAKQGTKYPDTAESGETYDVEQAERAWELDPDNPANKSRKE